MTKSRNTESQWGLALSGGGARGLVQVGVLQAIEECGLKPSCISGTSIGAVVGSLYAAGMKPMDMLALLSGKGFLNLFRLKPSLSGLLGMKYLEEVLDKNLPETFAELPIPLHVFATNLSRGECVDFHSGELRQPILASASIPILFEPVTINGEKYVDGGVMNNLPAEACLSSCSYVLGVEVNKGKFTQNLKTMKNVALEVFHLVVNRSSEEGMKVCDYVLRPEMEASFDLLDFSKAKNLFDLGYEEGLVWAKSFKSDQDKRSIETEISKS
ncbi:MAG TPA: patatin-like phospholipase family protein [Cryomorphaceae bacterium]|nr:patatin-like phospholipase family protein [Cryomorphaceae bacterium]